MNTVNKILVPVDFSDESARALKQALSLAAETRAELVVLHVIEKTDDRDFLMTSVLMLEGSPFPVSEFPSVPADVLLRERSLDLWNFVAQAIGTSNRIKIAKRVRMGGLLKTMIAMIHQEGVDLVVMQLRGRISFPSLKVLKLIRMIRRLPCPVLLESPSHHDHSEPRKGLCWLQPSPRETPA